MIDAQLNYELQRHRAIRDRLLAEEEDIDEQTLADTVEGLTDLHELLAAIVRGALSDEDQIVAIKRRIDLMLDRMSRFQNRAERRRAIVRDVMMDADIKKIAADDFTASLRASPPSVILTDEKIIPADYIEQRPHIKRREILDALKDGDVIDGAMLANPSMVLSVRTR